MPTTSRSSFHDSPWRLRNPVFIPRSLVFRPDGSTGAHSRSRVFDCFQVEEKEAELRFLELFGAWNIELREKARANFQRLDKDYDDYIQNIAGPILLRLQKEVAALQEENLDLKAEVLSRRKHNPTQVLTYPSTFKTSA